VRWVVVLAALMVLVRSLRSWRRRAAFTVVDDRLQGLLVRSADVQLALGLLLYVVLSPISSAFLSDIHHAIHEDDLRFFGLGHPLMMMLAVAVLHLGRRRLSRPAATPFRHRVAYRSTLAFLLVAGSAVPW